MSPMLILLSDPTFVCRLAKAEVASRQRGLESRVAARVQAAYPRGISRLLLLDLLDRTESWSKDGQEKKLTTLNWSASRDLFQG